ncbi:unnamed protein product [Protopolystoma xenopodis]|uniref:WDHD1/CFT4 second beta-propeller domain-containing protein n=1 Tax=Protopolystoma xenopodis TaxID=117903 RepID=A0A448WP23_9PLAT|nr:unnamed protein product [Protopolystoma xenopodis]
MSPLFEFKYDSCDFHWVPVCDTRAALKPANRRSDTYFLVGVIESVAATSSQSAGGDEAEVASGVTSGGAEAGLLQAIYCKGSRWPRVLPRPLVSSLQMRLPLCHLDRDQAALEHGSNPPEEFPTISLIVEYTLGLVR